MKIIQRVLYATYIILLAACGHKPDQPNPIQQPSQQTITDSITPFSPPSIGGVLFLPEDEYDKLPKYIVDTKGGRLSAQAISLDMPPPGNQYTEGACVGFATGYSVRSYLYHIEKGTSYWSGLNIRNNKSVFSPRFVYNAVLQQLGRTEDKGIPIIEALNLLKNTGVCTWEDMPFQPHQTSLPISEAQRQLAGNYKIKSFTALPVNGHIKDYIKDYLERKSLPVIIAIYCDEGFQEPKKNIGNGYQIINKEFYWKEFKKLGFNKDGSPFGHAITVIGFDDDKKAFKLLNSYGNNWTGDDGTIWMDYNLFDAMISINGVNKRVIKEAYVVLNSMDGIKLAPTTATGKIDVSYVCDGDNSKPKGLNYPTYHYDFIVHTNETYDKKLEKHLCLILPSKKVFYSLKLNEFPNGDGKTFTTSFYHAPESAVGQIVGGVIFAIPYYKPYDIKYLPSSLTSEIDITDIYTPSGTYEYILTIQKEVGRYDQYIQSERKSFPKPFFDVTNCINKREAAPGVNLYTVDL